MCTSGPMGYTSMSASMARGPVSWWVIVAADENGSKELLSVTDGFRES